MDILAIETSCDETSAAVVSNGTNIKSMIVSSQIKIHSKFSGVVPELASRSHMENINFVIHQSLSEANIDFNNFSKKIDAVAFTSGPGLAGALLIGTIASKAIASVYKKPLIPVNHLEGHLYSYYINNSSIYPPFLGVIISGGHTEIIIVEKFGKYKTLGITRDDAAGEAFDKAAKILGLSYPGGPIIDEMSKNGDPTLIQFTRPLLKNGWDFSFSGLKTALLNYVKTNQIKSKKHLSDICASFRQAIVETIVFKAFKAAKVFNLKNIVLGGGVSANSLIRKMFINNGNKYEVNIFIPALIHCTDNAAIIGCAAYLKQKKCGLNYNSLQLKSDPSLTLYNW
ncbi:MAG: tRNA (adenosine(37)-N6)-threonylcarbamoyltransferase complex transferase subunit TsaD [Endomicrobium sp.]|jgi:N6-L-threonylcarbamoyladenine synthase|nr:tRNA (adenosine(37)-N6)-threonylcarbamoyltransferase complex transferase subunit TsaD [Endomicrobium sp.]